MGRRLSQTIDEVADELEHQVRVAEQMARAQLMVDQVPAEDVRRVRERLEQRLGQGNTLRGICDDHADEIARTLDVADPQPAQEPGSKRVIRTAVETPVGYVVREFGIVRPRHVYAVAAIIAAERLPTTVAGAFEPWYLAYECAFMAGRQEMRSAVEGEAKQRRSEQGAKGSRPKLFEDHALLAARAAWIQQHGHERGWQKDAARRLDVTESAVGKRWRELKNKQQPG